MKNILLTVACVLTCGWAMAQEPLTRGIGIYPGRPSETNAPNMVQADNTLRNVALHRRAWASSAYDYNLTAQLLTDGIIDTTSLARLEVWDGRRWLPRREREWTVDGSEWTRSYVMGSNAQLLYRWHGMSVKADAVHLVARLAYNPKRATQGAQFVISREKEVLATLRFDSLPGRESRWRMHSDPNKQTGEDRLPTRNIDTTIVLDGVQDISTMRLALQMRGAEYWEVDEMVPMRDGRPVEDILPSHHFHSAWMSGDGTQHRLTIDIGEGTEVADVRLHWVDGHEGKLVGTQREGQYLHIDVKGRNIALTEVEVMGRGGQVPQAKDAATAWRVARGSEVKGDAAAISSNGYDDSSWLVATVPATVLSSYVNAEAIPNPNEADDMFQISESFFNSDFWYRHTFSLTPSPSPIGRGAIISPLPIGEGSGVGLHWFLNLDGINWKADIYLNGHLVHNVAGAFRRGRVDVTRWLQLGENTLAVHILPCPHPAAVKEKNRQNTDFNGGWLGADNPTFHATVGWDWISTIRGRDIGIWNDIYLTQEQDITISDPVVVSTVEDAAEGIATMRPAVRLTNNARHAVIGHLRGVIAPTPSLPEGREEQPIVFEQLVTVPALSTIEVTFDPTRFPQLAHQPMHLWWPNGYGTPYLYDASYTFTPTVNCQLSTINCQLSTINCQLSTINYNVGIRELTYSDIDTHLQIYVNHQRINPMGGNWGFSENNLNYRAREYDIAVGFHREMNMNMIRNWVGQTGDREFYEACDRNGILVWQDFWLANPADGPNPDDEDMFMDNAYDYVYRIRQHPCIALYCGRNEGFPPETLNNALRECIKAEHPGILYIGSSADDGVSGHGPYWALPRDEYFEKQTGKLHSERGMPNVMNVENTLRTLISSKTQLLKNSKTLWPQNDAWGQHDYVQEGAQRGATFNRLVDNYGTANDVESFTRLAQWVNYEGYRAMYEANNVDRQGLVIWMSHPCWPSMTWQTYDYYFEPTAAFFGAKKACEPLHVQFDSHRRQVQIINQRTIAPAQYKVNAAIYNRDGRKLSDTDQRINLSRDTTMACLPVLPLPEDNATYILRLTLSDTDGNLVSENTYLYNASGYNYRDLTDNASDDVVLEEIERSDTMCTVRVTNRGSRPALLVRLRLLADDGDLILPAHYTDNYFHLLPGESHPVTITWHPSDTRGGQAHVTL